MQQTIIIGDCLTEMRKLPDASQELILTSPPYNIHEKGIGSFPKTNGTWKNAKLRDGYATYSDDLPPDEYEQWQRDCLTEMWRILSPHGVIFYNHKPRIKKGVLWHPSCLVPEHIPLRQIIIWHRNGGFNFNAKAFLNTHEYILVMAKPDFRMAKGKRGIHDVWSFPPAKGNDHPAPFPIDLPLRAIEATGLSKIFDPFAGSGTTGVAAKQSGCDFLGIELDEGYAQAARDRIRNL